MYHFSIAPSDYLAPSFENKLNMCDRLGCGYVEILDHIKGRFLGDMSGNEVEDMRNLLIDYGKSISLVTYTESPFDTDRFKKLLRVAHLLHVKAIKLVCDGYSDIDTLRTDLEQCAKFAHCYQIQICIENKCDSLLAHDRDVASLIKTCSQEIGTIINPLEYVFMRSHPFFHEFYASKLKNSVRFLRVNDGLFCEKTPTMPGRGNAEIKELASILLARSFDGFFSFTDYVGTMCWADLMEYVSLFRDMLKSM